MPEWGNLDILKACGASDPGSNPGSGVQSFLLFVIFDAMSTLTRVDILNILMFE